NAAALDKAVPRLARLRRGTRTRTRRRPVHRFAVWLLPILLVFGVAVAAVGFYARRSYFVGIDNGRVTLFKGVPGGVAGWDPTIERRTTIRARDLRTSNRAEVRDDKHFSSRGDADAYLSRLARNTTTTTTSSSTTTTTTTTTTTLAPTTTAPAPTP
ncbi:MAG TPA: hypothetical protein VGA11_01180, partial [Acidimicrobiia bacterium]